MPVGIESGPWGTPVNTTTTNSASITTGEASYILVGIAADNTTHTGSNHVVSVTATGLTFTKLCGGSCPDTGICCEYWGAVSSGALSSVAVTVTVSSSSNTALGVLSLSGVSASPVGVTVAPAQVQGNVSCAFTGTTAGSMLFAVSFEPMPYTDYGITPTAGAETTLWENQNYITQHLRSTSALAAGGAHTLSTTGFTANLYQQYSGVEILAATATNTTVTATAGAISVAGQTATTNNASKVGATAGAISVAGQTATTNNASKVGATAGAISIAGQTATTNNASKVGATAGAISVAGQTATTNNASKVGATAGAISVAGQTASIVSVTAGHATTDATAGAITVAGQTATTNSTIVVGATAGAISVAGQTATIASARNTAVVASAGSIDISGNVISIKRSTRTQADPGSVSISGQDITAANDVRVSATTCQILVSGYNAQTLSRSIVYAVQGAVSCVGYKSTIKISNAPRFTGYAVQVIVRDFVNIKGAIR